MKVNRISKIPSLIAVLLLMFLVTPLQTGTQAQSVISNAESSGWIDVSDKIGFPLGGIGTGYSTFGKYGFVKINFDGRPKDRLHKDGIGEWQYEQKDAIETADFLKDLEAEYNAAKNGSTSVTGAKMERLQKKYDDALKYYKMVNSPEGFAQSTFGFTIADGKDTYILQTNKAGWKKDAIPFEKAQVSACLPQGLAVFSDKDAELVVSVKAFSPLIPHDLESSTIPVQVYDVTIKNTSATPRKLKLSLENSILGIAQTDRTIFKSETGEMAFAAENGNASNNGVTVSVSLSPGFELTQRFYVSWFFPKVDEYKRYYTNISGNATSVINIAKKNATDWNTRINNWHNSIQVPSYLKRIWFGSLSSIITSTVMTADPYFFEIETPHPLFNTMDVSVYSGWVYLINWPELEKMDMNQYFKITPKTGEKAGLILHSLWDDEAPYVEEPTFMCRLRRDALWFNDKKWTKEGFEIAKLSADRVYKLDNFEYLINNKHGNQSYDIWRMPGVSSYVNSTWVYGLDGMRSIAASFGNKKLKIANIPVKEMLSKALVSYDKYLWNKETNSWNLFYRTPGAYQESTPETLFTDQLFGLWVAAIDKKSDKHFTCRQNYYSIKHFVQ